MSAQLLGASLLLLGLVAPPAAADVLVSRPTTALRCGEAIRTGVWYREYPRRGSRGAVIEIRSARDTVLWRRAVSATGEWRYWRYVPDCGRTYVVRYVTEDGPVVFRVSVRPAGRRTGR